MSAYKKCMLGVFAVGAMVAATVGHARDELLKQHYNYSEWTKGRFAEAVVVEGAQNARLIYLAGIGAEEAEGKPGEIRAPNDIAGQCAYAFEKIDLALKRNDATADDIVKMTVYLTSADFIPAFSECRDAYFEKTGARLPAETLLIISRLAWPDMLLEVDINAVAR